MNWYVLIGVVLVVIFFAVTRALGNLNAEVAHEYLSQGAMVIDVRSEAEFADKSIDGVVNIPLPVLSERIGKAVPDKNSIILLHCRSGNRSGQGAKILQGMGYEKTYNLGSYGHAAKVMESQPAKAE